MRVPPKFDMVIAWRWEAFVRVGVGNALAGFLAESDADLHRTVKMIKDGCSEELLERILL